MKLEERINILSELGRRLKAPDDYLDALMKRTEINNGWLTIENQKKAISAIVDFFLDEQKLTRWVEYYGVQQHSEARKLGLIMAGNIPLVGFHDFLCVFITGHHAIIKLSSKDPYLFPHLIKIMKSIDNRVGDVVEIVDRLAGYDAVIATGSNNSARYFETYFGKVPHIIRKNRNGIAILTGEETERELIEFGKDVFDFFGLGCRNVSKIYIPKNYDFEPLLRALHTYNQIVLHTKYKNNFDYNYAIYMLNKVQYIANGCIILIEQSAIPSNIATLHFEYYENMEFLEKELLTKKDEIQVIVAGKTALTSTKTVWFGMAQQPKLDDYADGVDTMDFLVHL